MNVSDAGRAFIEQNEGCCLEAYWDVDGYSIGYGHHGAGVTEGLQITRAQADTLLAHDLVWVEAAINVTITAEISQNAFDALADFVYNEGPGALRTSTLARLINSGVKDPDRIRMAFCMWDRVKGAGADLVVSAALLARRQAEAALFLIALRSLFSFFALNHPRSYRWLMFSSWVPSEIWAGPNSSATAFTHAGLSHACRACGSGHRPWASQNATRWERSTVWPSPILP